MQDLIAIADIEGNDWQSIGTFEFGPVKQEIVYRCGCFFEIPDKALFDRANTLRTDILPEGKGASRAPILHETGRTALFPCLDVFQVRLTVQDHVVDRTASGKRRRAIM